MGELVSAALGMCGLFLYAQHRLLGLGTGTLRDHQVNKQINLRSRLRLMVSLTSLSLLLSPVGSVGGLLDFGGRLRLIRFSYLGKAP